MIRINGLQDVEGFVRFEHYEGGTYPNPTSSIVPVQCMHCADAPCEKVCPTGATYITDSGVVLVDEEKCIDCKYCVAACPYDVRTPIQGAAPYVDKCRFCFDGAKGAPDSPSCTNTCINWDTGLKTGINRSKLLEKPARAHGRGAASSY